MSISNIRYLRRLAQSQRTKFVESLDEFDAGFIPTSDAACTKWILKYPGRIVISENSQIYTSTDEHRIWAAAQGYLAERSKKKNLPPPVVIATAPHVLEQVFRAHYEKPVEDEGVETSEDSASRSEAQVYLDSIVDAAVRHGVSDVHIHVSGVQAKIYFRIDGLIRPFKNNANPGGGWSSSDIRSMCAAAINSEAAKANGVAALFNDKEKLDATFPMRTSRGEVLKIRYSQTPHNANGYRVILRLLSSGPESSNIETSLETLGYLNEQALLIDETITAPSGLVIVSGPTGSGKTTTLSWMMKMIPETKAVYTFEDPVENVIPNACQVFVNDESATCNLKAHSKNALRLDPDVLMYGEIRDAAVAEDVVQAATTGHLVLTSLHTNSAISCVTRLNDIGVSYRRLAEPGFLKLLVFQRLIQAACPSCNLDYKESLDAGIFRKAQLERLVEYFKADLSAIRFANMSPSNSCTSCGGVGTTGRVLVCEVVKIDEPARLYISEGDMAGWHRNLRSRGWISIMDHAEQHVRRGAICPVNTESMLGDTFGLIDDESVGFDYAAFRASINRQGRPTRLVAGVTG